MPMAVKATGGYHQHPVYSLASRTRDAEECGAGQCSACLMKLYYSMGLRHECLGQ